MPLNSLLSIFLLGLVHGLTPDEHTWPVIFAYSVQQKKIKKSIKTAVYFALAATIPWTILAAIVGYLGSILIPETWEVYFHILLGGAIILLGIYTVIYQHIPHLHIGHQKGHQDKPPKPFKTKQAFIYGLILGSGPCAPVLLMYGFAAQSQSVLIGIFAGLLFGLATLLTLGILAGILGGLVQYAQAKIRRNLSKILAYISGFVLIVFGTYLITELLIS